MNGRPPPAPLPPRVRAALEQLALALRAMPGDPRAVAVMRGLEQSFPEAAAEIRAIVENPIGALGQAFARAAADALAERGLVDQALAKGLRRAFGKPSPPRAPRKRRLSR